MHTPGPWRFAPFLGEPADLEKMRELGMEPTPATTNEGQRYIMAGEGDYTRRVCLVDMQIETKRSERYKSADAERDANARLIAACPAMLEALQDIVEQFEASSIMVGPDLADSISVFGKQAIALATEG